MTEEIEEQNPTSELIDKVLGACENLTRECGYSLPSAWAMSFFIDHGSILLEALKDHPNLCEDVNNLIAEISDGILEWKDEEDEEGEDDDDAFWDDDIPDGWISAEG